MPGVPGVATHVPKRSQQRRRRNAVQVDSGPSAVATRGPDAPEWLTGLPLAWYESLRTSGQSAWYTDSDWTAALVVAKAIKAFEDEPKAALLAAILSGFNSLAATEGDRRRLRLELEQVGGEAGDVAEIDDYRARMRPSS